MNEIGSAEDASMGHVRLDETSAKVTKGKDLYSRISWIIELLTYEKKEAQEMLQAAEHEKAALNARVYARESRQRAAEYRAAVARMTETK